ncbi:hypothetical protein LZY01_07500 [Levilactobacillus zymae]|uniref:XRE family transcriptional regulator n=2 Tax=Levilactobacillus zymae TaxID=267363 RepID=A0ABQ0WVP8_9LACO|nr:hypothetical protein [Levilactobacillus zymae]KRL07585.1 hypothetical protein FD38_GL000102 [Levilactobacillus zymae DSM 19395]GEO71582.1 hypothetical protein LZY01_07500 [Levilactobacillus zymae]
MTSKTNKEMLKSDISSRMKQEEHYVKVPPAEKKSSGKTLNIVISVAIAIIVLAGILYPLVNLF